MCDFHNKITLHFDSLNIMTLLHTHQKMQYDFNDNSLTVIQPVYFILPCNHSVTAALSADLESKSEWSASKARGEAAVREEFPNAVCTHTFMQSVSQSVS